jgi:hypothetical protein
MKIALLADEVQEAGKYRGRWNTEGVCLTGIAILGEQLVKKPKRHNEEGGNRDVVDLP